MDFVNQYDWISLVALYNLIDSSVKALSDLRTHSLQFCRNVIENLVDFFFIEDRIPSVH